MLRRNWVQCQMVTFVIWLIWFISWRLLINKDLASHVILVFYSPFIYIFHCPHCLLLAWIFIIWLNLILLVSYFKWFVLSYFVKSVNLIILMVLGWLKYIISRLSIDVAKLRSFLVFWQCLSIISHLRIDRHIRLRLMAILFRIRVLLEWSIINTNLSVLNLCISFIFGFGNFGDQGLRYWWNIKAIRTIGKLSLKIKIDGTFHHFIIFIILIIVCI